MFVLGPRWLRRKVWCSEVQKKMATATTKTTTAVVRTMAAIVAPKLSGRRSPKNTARSANALIQPESKSTIVLANRLMDFCIRFNTFTGFLVLQYSNIFLELNSAGIE